MTGCVTVWGRRLAETAFFCPEAAGKTLREAENSVSLEAGVGWRLVNVYIYISL